MGDYISMTTGAGLQQEAGPSARHRSGGLTRGFKLAIGAGVALFVAGSLSMTAVAYAAAHEASDAVGRIGYGLVELQYAQEPHRGPEIP